ETSFSPTAGDSGKNKTSRNDALDITKGILVVVMVLYHWLNYFVVLDWDIYRYLRFITPSFVLITGFVLSSIYLKKYRPTDVRLHYRLVSRGLKLLMLFTALNLVGVVLFNRHQYGIESSIRGFFANAYEIYFSGSGRATFEILVPIGYFLVLTPLVL